jgi:DeoR/GlpR family transcriptional regulator of sugar metabolism
MRHNTEGRPAPNSPIAAERRRRIYDLVLQNSFVTVTDLARGLGVVENTIRRDLDFLHREGLIVRSHGGATAREQGTPAPPYAQTRATNMLQKSVIGQAASSYLPAEGAVFINAGTTTFQLAIRIPRETRLHIMTNSPETAIYLVSNTEAQVDICGGRLIPESFETDGSTAGDILDNLHWDVSFMGLTAIDPTHGITSINLDVATLERKVMENSLKVVALCDSSKFGRIAHAKSGPVSLVHTLITDNGAKLADVRKLESKGVRIVVAESDLGGNT